MSYSSRSSSRATDCKVYVGDLGNGAAKGELERAFSYYGPLRSVWVARNPPGFAFVEYEDARDAEDAVKGMDGKVLCGARVRVEMSNGMSRKSRYGRPSRRQFDPNDRCYQCGESGHYAYDCYRFSKRRSRRSRSTSRSRSRSRGRRYRSRSRSNERRYRSPSYSKRKSRSGSPGRSRSRTPVRRSRSPVRRSKSPVRRSRSRTPVRRVSRSRSRSRSGSRQRERSVSRSRSRSRSVSHKKDGHSRSASPRRSPTPDAD
ncbi:serine and arginine rich splicing factor 7a isoform X1 [Carassius auratus]|uniref:Serine/arginine-rich splicing factor 7-like isoform X1 n=1 Tax=Carassius auratus TaxID=7957 RepID=A0A6P6N7A4_CARAU|nr:serine/arginine-rich splicing factor 7-like isoform X1 [Carassius auratus]XP_026105055.1 serine/arginine-rich splicing factor 7-like isoform X1 [Carassius auratus]XP_026105058.1 serine/arginine-rich splicing factor 7-like isoform X1 [Carassius auratus]XP_026105065.1 serine/arginine-rich splicing factor 7-like isoform X1 [Carassius auratus]XP_026105070.1 serine/arginine-rich splicing factor 7-like isoform X1 [Carassius auratus]XP_052448590.1 serine and arginine rich splicing factor 7a isofor